MTRQNHFWGGYGGQYSLGGPPKSVRPDHAFRWDHLSMTVHSCMQWPVTQKLIRVKIDPAGSLLVAIIDPAGSLLAAKSDPPLQKVIRVQILVDSSLF